MAFELNRLRQWNVGNAVANDGSIKRMWIYLGFPDTLTAILADPNYFNGAHFYLTPGDMIRVVPNLENGFNITDVVVQTIVSEVVTTAPFEYPIVNINGNQSQNYVAGNMVGTYKSTIGFSYNTGTPPAPINFNGAYDIVDCYVNTRVIPNGATTLTVRIDSTDFCTFAVTAVPGITRLTKVNDFMQGQLEIVGPGSDFSWEATTPANVGSGTIFFDLLAIA